MVAKKKKNAQKLCMSQHQEGLHNLTICLSKGLPCRNRPDGSAHCQTWCCKWDGAAGSKPSVLSKYFSRSTLSTSLWGMRTCQLDLVSLSKPHSLFYQSTDIYWVPTNCQTWCQPGRMQGWIKEGILRSSRWCDQVSGCFLLLKSPRACLTWKRFISL